MGAHQEQLRSLPTETLASTVFYDQRVYERHCETDVSGFPKPRQIQRWFRFSLRHRGGGGNEPSCGGVYDPVVPMGNVASEEVNAALVYAWVVLLSDSEELPQQLQILRTSQKQQKQQVNKRRSPDNVQPLAASSASCDTSQVLPLEALIHAVDGVVVLVVPALEVD